MLKNDIIYLPKVKPLHVRLTIFQLALVYTVYCLVKVKKGF